jgi:hypothetical protein
VADAHLVRPWEGVADGTMILVASHGAPGAIRTHTERDLNPLPLPLGYGGSLRGNLSAPDRPPGFDPVTIGGITVRPRDRPVF